MLEDARGYDAPCMYGEPARCGGGGGGGGGCMEDCASPAWAWRCDIGGSVVCERPCDWLGPAERFPGGATAEEEAAGASATRSEGEGIRRVKAGRAEGVCGDLSGGSIGRRDRRYT